MEHVRAMKTVRTWEETQRFGHVGASQTSRANSARVLDYFSDCYSDSKEAVRKAELFLSVYDFIGRNAGFFSRKGLVEQLGEGLFSVDSALLRSVHFAYSSPDRPVDVNLKKTYHLARAFKQFETV